MKKTAVVLGTSPGNEFIYKKQLAVLNSICSDYKNCPLVLERIDHFVMGDIALSELVKKIVLDREVIIIDFSQITEKDIRLKFLELINNCKKPDQQVVITVFSKKPTMLSDSMKNIMNDTMSPSLKPVQIVYYVHEHKFRQLVQNVLEGTFVFEEEPAAA